MENLSPRAELLKLHHQIYKKNKKIIEESVIHEDAHFKRYEKKYLKAVQRYQKISSIEEIMEAVLEADIVFVGDYHTLGQSQRSFLRILRALVEKTKDFCIAMEVIQSRHQQSLDRLLAGRLTEEIFLKKIGFKEHWFFDLWENFKPLFDFAKLHHLPMYGLEASPEDATSLKERDQAAALVLFDLYHRTKCRPILVFVGDLHVAPSHLPLDVKKLFRQKKKSVKTVTLYQNSESIYWKLADMEMEDRIGVVKISANEYCRMHTPPIIAQQSYLNWLEHEEGTLDFADAKQTFLGYLEQMAQFLGIELSPEKDEVEVFTCGDLSFLKRLREEKIFSKKELQEIKRQILQSESYYIPKKKFVYLANVSVNHAAEEAAHTLRNLCAGFQFLDRSQSLF